MNLTVKGRNLVLTEAISAYAEEKIGRLGKYLAEGSRCEVEMWTEKNPSIADNQVVEVTIFTKGPVIRAREASPDIYASIDLVFEKLERQVKKYRGKLQLPSGNLRSGRLSSAEGFQIPEETEEGEEEAPAPRIVKTKQFMVKPMTPEEAALQLELVGHDFFVFTNCREPRDGGGVSSPRRQLRADRSPELTVHCRPCVPGTRARLGGDVVPAGHCGTPDSSIERHGR